MTLNIYAYKQNNSGGNFITDEDVANRVYIEAESFEKANEKALEIGIYFDGVEEGYDCSCCGDRWSKPYYSFTNEFALYEESGYRISFTGQGTKEEVEDQFEIEFGGYGKIEELEFADANSSGLSKLTAKLYFYDIESYIAYISYEYGHTIPDAILHYADGTKKVFY